MPLIPPDLWINRNIVECKFAWKNWTYLSGLELIETLWNVNDIIGVQKMVTRPGINRNIVECKF